MGTSCKVFDSFASALKACEELEDEIENIFIIGGSSVYDVELLLFV